MAPDKNMKDSGCMSGVTDTYGCSAGEMTQGFTNGSTACPTSEESGETASDNELEEMC